MAPHLDALESIGFSGSISPDLNGKTSWAFRLKDRSDTRYDLTAKLDLSQSPLDAELSLSAFQCTYSEFREMTSGYVSLPDSEGSVSLRNIRGAGKFGDWLNWSLSLELEIEAEQISLASTGQSAANPKISARINGKGGEWEGSARLSAASLLFPPLTEPFTDIKTGDHAFKYTRGSLSFSGGAAFKDPRGNPFSATYKLSPNGSFQVDGKCPSFNLRTLRQELGGQCSLLLSLSGNTQNDKDPALSLSLESDSLSWEETRMTGVMRSSLSGALRGGRTPSWTAVDINWENSLNLTLRGIAADSYRIDIAKASVSGNLDRINRLFPNIKLPETTKKWIHPSRWKYEGALSMTLSPFFGIHIENGQVDNGLGVRGPVSFSYTAETRGWTFTSPTLVFQTSELLKSTSLPYLNLTGTVSATANLNGKMSGSSSVGEWISTANIRGKIENVTGDISNPADKSPGNLPWFGIRDLNGSFEIQTNSVSKRLSASLFVKDFSFYTPQPLYNNDYPRALSAPMRLNLLIAKNADAPYEVKSMQIQAGDISPLQLDIRGYVEERGGQWIPDLKVKGDMNHAEVTPVFRGVQMGGDGVMVGSIKGSRTGNWVYNGDVECNGVRFEIVGPPVICQNIRGTFYLRDVCLDELLSRKRWLERKHTLPADPDQQDSLAKAFTQSADSPVNLRIDAVRVGSAQYNNLKVRTILIGETFFMNTVDGFFASGNYPLKITGFVFIIPGVGPGWRVRGSTERVPLSIGVPGLFETLNLDHELVDVSFYITRTPPGERIETRFLSLDFPIGRLKSIPAVGPLLFGWTPESLNSQEFILQKVGDGKWQPLNPFQLPSATQIPRFILYDAPKEALNRLHETGTSFFRGMGEEIEGFIHGDSSRRR